MSEKPQSGDEGNSLDRPEVAPKRGPSLTIDELLRVLPDTFGSSELEERQKGIEISGFDKAQLAKALGVSDEEIVRDPDQALMVQILDIYTLTNVVQARIQEISDGIFDEIRQISLKDLPADIKAQRCESIVQRLQDLLRAQKENDESMSEAFRDAIKTLPPEQQAAAVAYIQKQIGSEI